MNVSLWVRNADPFGVKTLFDLTRKIPVDGPIITGLDPGAAEQIDRRVGQFIYVDREGGLVEDQRMLGGDLVEDIDSVLDIVIVT